jgi:hypothetical protein
VCCGRPRPPLQQDQHTLVMMNRCRWSNAMFRRQGGVRPFFFKQAPPLSLSLPPPHAPIMLEKRHHVYVTGLLLCWMCAIKAFARGL